MKEKLQISKELRQEIASLNGRIALLSQFPTDELPNPSKEIYLPAIIFNEFENGCSNLKEQIAVLKGSCITYRTMLKDDSKAYIDYSIFINDLDKLLQTL